MHTTPENLVDIQRKVELEGYVEWIEERKKDLLGNLPLVDFWASLFWWTDKLFHRYTDQTNRWPENGIPSWTTKLSFLESIQALDKDILELGRELFGSEEKLYTILLRYNEFNQYGNKYKTIPLYFPQDVLREYLPRVESWDFGVA